jgi:hypothetical protein
MIRGSSLDLESQPARRHPRTEGVLVTNGHANLFIEPRIDGWLREQRETHRRIVEFLHLDALVDWVTEHHLVNELRVALREQGIDAGDA